MILAHGLWLFFKTKRSQKKRNEKKEKKETTAKYSNLRAGLSTSASGGPISFFTAMLLHTFGINPCVKIIGGLLFAGKPPNSLDQRIFSDG